MAYANWQLENPSAANINVAKWMGLFVVARLAAQHGTRVRLRPGEPGGLTALVWLPDEVLTHQGATASPMLSDFGSARSAPGVPEAVDSRLCRHRAHDDASEVGGVRVSGGEPAGSARSAAGHRYGSAPWPRLVARRHAAGVVRRAAGTPPGRAAGAAVGRAVGTSVGRAVGTSVGRAVGASVGRAAPGREPPVGRAAGAPVGRAASRAAGAASRADNPASRAACDPRTIRRRSARCNRAGPRRLQHAGRCPR